MTVLPVDAYEIEDDGNFYLFKHIKDLENGKMDERKLRKPGIHVNFFF